MTDKVIRSLDKNDLNKLTVYKDNKLIEAAYNLTLIEQHLILTCIAQINPKVELTVNDEFMISTDNYMDLFDVSRDIARKNIKIGISKLWDRSIFIKNSLGNIEETRWIDKRIKWDDGSMVGLRFTKEIIDYLTHLDSFTRYKLNLISEMTSPNAIRLYEIFVQKTAMGITKIDIDIEWLRKQFCLTTKYDSFGDFNTRILIPSIKQINKHSNLTIALHTSETGKQTFGKPLKRGRLIYGYTYVVRYKKGKEHKTLKQAGLEASKNKPQPVKPELAPVENSNPELLPAQASQLPAIAQKEQPPQVFKSYPNKNYGAKKELSNTERLLAKVAKDVEMGFYQS